jgi:membrane associated rhomboid family serine protease
MKKLAKIFGSTLAIAGVFTAVCLVDGSAHEIAIRLGGVAAFIVGLLIWSASEKETVQ